MSGLQAVQFAFGAASMVMSCVAQGCCWYHFFRCCGCIEESQEQQRIHQVQVVEIGQPKGPNPFLNPNAPRDEHLRSAYG